MANIPEGFDFRTKVLELQTAILDKHPTMPVLLQTLHRTLKQYPEQVTLLEESEIQVIVRGLIAQTGVEFAATAATPKGNKSAAAKIKNLGSAAF